MYLDFLGVCFDQLLNQAAKLPFMTGGAAEMALTVRTQFGAGRSSGSQHSQSLEALLAHIPGLTVVMPSTPADTYGLLRAAIQDPNPVVFIENRLLYGMKGPQPPADHIVPIGASAVVRPGTDVTVVSVSRMVHEALAAAERVAGEGISVEVIDLRTVAPLDMAPDPRVGAQDQPAAHRPRGGRALRHRRRDRRHRRPRGVLGPRRPDRARRRRRHPAALRPDARAGLAARTATTSPPPSAASSRSDAGGPAHRPAVGSGHLRSRSRHVPPRCARIRPPHGAGGRMAQTATGSTRLRSGNPALSETFVEAHLTTSATRSMTVAGVSIKTLVLLAVLVAGGAWGWSASVQPTSADLGNGYADTTVTIPGGFWLASFAALFLGIFIAVQPTRAALLGVLYAVCEGFCLGAISASFDAQTDGIVGAAVLSTVCVFVAALVLYITRLVKPTRKMAFAVIAGMGGLALLYLFVFVLSIFDWGWLYSDSFRSIGLVVTLIAIVLAALSLVLDFGTIEAGVQAGAPKELEWYLGFGLMVTLVWLYISILKLLALLSRR